MTILVTLLVTSVFGTGFWTEQVVKKLLFFVFILAVLYDYFGILEFRFNLNSFIRQSFIIYFSVSTYQFKVRCHFLLICIVYIADW